LQLHFDPQVTLGTLIDLAGFVITVAILFAKIEKRLISIEIKTDLMFKDWRSRKIKLDQEDSDDAIERKVNVSRPNRGRTN
jgi:hypothetical protein